MLRWTRLLYFGGRTSSYARDVFCTSVDTLHIFMLRWTSSVLRWIYPMSSVLRRIHFMLCWTRLLYFGGCISSFARDVFCTSVDTLHFFMLAGRLLYFGGYTLHVFCTSGDTLHVTLDTSVFCSTHTDIVFGCFWAVGRCNVTQMYMKSLEKLSASCPDGKESLGLW